MELQDIMFIIVHRTLTYADFRWRQKDVLSLAWNVLGRRRYYFHGEDTPPQARAGEGGEGMIARDREETNDVAIQPKIRRGNTKGMKKFVQYGFSLDTFPKRPQNGNF